MFAARQLTAGAARAVRSFTNSAKAAGGHGGHDDYVHAPTMYNLPAMKNRKLKMGLGVLAVVGGGVGLTLFAVELQLYKGRQ